MLTLALSVVADLRTLYVPRHKLALEAVALRQQLAVLKRKQTHPRLHHLDRFFWTALRRVYSGWAEALIIVKPETVVSWHRAGFRLFWRWRSRQRRPGRPRISGEIRELIRRIGCEAHPMSDSLPSTANCSSSDSRLPNPPCHAIFGG